MLEIYSTAKVCDSSNTCIPLQPGMYACILLQTVSIGQRKFNLLCPPQMFSSDHKGTPKRLNILVLDESLWDLSEGLTGKNQILKLTYVGQTPFWDM